MNLQAGADDSDKKDKNGLNFVATNTNQTSERDPFVHSTSLTVGTLSFLTRYIYLDTHSL